MSKKVVFSKINPKNCIYKELEKQPKWWSLLYNDKELYVEIRKDNYINVYYLGASVAKISYKKNEFVVETHQKYLGDSEPREKTPKGKDKFEYYKIIDLSKLDENLISKIKNCIISEKNNQKDEEKPAEKWIQGKMKIDNSRLIDSEFQFNQDGDIGKLRIDLIELSDGILTFIELKGITDSRLRNDKKRNLKEPEIIAQMEKYKKFIAKYEVEILKHYHELIKIKHSLGLLLPNDIEIKSLNKTPKLIIENTYKKQTNKRKNRIHEIEQLLKENLIEYKIVCKSPSIEA